MTPTLEENEILKLHFHDAECSFFFDEETQAWVIDPDDEEQEAIILQSPEHGFQPITINGASIDEEVFELLMGAYRLQTIH